jgi:hypothetical protein
VRYVARPEAGVQNRRRALLEISRWLGEEVKERDRLVVELVALAQRPRHAGAVGAPRGQVGKQGKSDIGARPVERQPGDERRVGLGARIGFVCAQRLFVVAERASECARAPGLPPRPNPGTGLPPAIVGSARPAP